MSSKNIAVRRDVYDALLREKRRGESFTELLVRFLGRRGLMQELRGSWGNSGLSEDLRGLSQLRARSGVRHR